jgi:hypothetical protein
LCGGFVNPKPLLFGFALIFAGLRVVNPETSSMVMAGPEAEYVSGMLELSTAKANWGVPMAHSRPLDMPAASRNLHKRGGGSKGAGHAFGRAVSFAPGPRPAGQPVTS